MRQVITRTVLAGSGALLGVIGGAMLTKTEAFLAMSSVEITPNPSLLSELKAPSLLLALAGATMLFGSVRISRAHLGLSVGAVVYGSYGLARLVGIVLDGVPSKSLLIATLIELVLAGLLLALRVSSQAPALPELRQLKAA